MARRLGNGRARRGFTLIEILLVIALIGIFVAIFVVNFDALLRQSESDAVESTFWEASRRARTRALLERKAQSLRFDEKASAFVVEQVGGGAAETFAIRRDDWSPETKLAIELQKRLPPGKFTLVQGELIEKRAIPAVEFYPDGTCTPFVLSLRVGAYENEIEIDPWTGAELLKADEN